MAEVAEPQRRLDQARSVDAETVAVVQGRPVTQLPTDLYIPPEALEVFLETFEGPLDLLLYLIRRQNLDILEINVAEITAQYIQYIELMHAMQLELAGEYLVMAALLAEIKSRMLLPRLPTGEEDEDDPRAVLIRRLQEYEQIKTAAEDLEKLPRVDRDVFPVHPARPELVRERVDPPVEMQELLLALAEVLRRAEMFTHHSVTLEPLSVRERMSDVLATISEARDFVPFHRLFRREEGRLGVIVTFLAMMELIRSGMVSIQQNAPFAPIYLRARVDEAIEMTEDDDRAAEQTDQVTEPDSDRVADEMSASAYDEDEVAQEQGSDSSLTLQQDDERREE
ncbi:MAG: segregation/condensation protein A [Pseudomonadales bacterium]|nr:segregation/condensation protein A [Pseudomonadales bacterium]MCP5182435.1 segregation/condensation protein A [Pseudomonadales bacterium]